MTKSWAEIFVKLFKSFSPSGLSLPRLHSWLHHTSSSIKYFGSLDGQTAETYESLHKSSVKILYRSTNKRKPINQMLNHPTANGKSINKHTELQFFETAGLCSDEYIRCTEQFYSEPMSSNTMICMNEDDNGNCCGNVLLLFKFTNSNYLNEDLALIQWYNFKYIDDPKS
ncbi:15554_t:CDS:2 [Entrophospora sp. SA101]|nr:15554_t:CDS:2 [Entrophospora sp. SA101]